MDRVTDTLQQNIPNESFPLPNKRKKYLWVARGIISLLVVIGISLGIVFTQAPQKTEHATISQSTTQSITKQNSSVAPVSSGNTVYPTISLANLPLGDNHYTMSGPKKGYVYVCRVLKGNEGAQISGGWIGTTTWTIQGKPTVQGSIKWSNAKFSNKISGKNRILSGNGLPVGMTTGIFPVSASDPAYQYDRNPNKIKAQTLRLTLPLDPTVSSSPNCMGGEVGVMNNGVPIFNAFDEQMRDAAAHEVQDTCDGHPQINGEYHYHNLSRCFKDIKESTVLGFALDGFPITGPVQSNGKYLTTDTLDECHGTTSTILLDGKQKTMYHYVMTEDFPYSVSCFRGKPVNLQVITTNGSISGQNKTQGQNVQGGMQQGNAGSMRQPPQEAMTSCSGKSSGSSCQFTTPNGTLSGTCNTPPNQNALACIPAMNPQMQR